VLTDTDKVGSIAGGGRYDNLVDAFMPQQPIPAVGFSVGIERIFAIMEQNTQESTARENDTQVLVVSVGGLLLDRFDICSRLWAKDIKAEFMYFGKPSMRRQLDFANAKGIPWVVIIGEDEKKAGIVKLKNMGTSAESAIPRDALAAHVQNVLCIPLEATASSE